MPEIELDIRRIRQRLEREGWVVRRENGPHDIFGHPGTSTKISVPRHRGDMAYGTARAIALKAGWLTRR